MRGSEVQGHSQQQNESSFKTEKQTNRIQHCQLQKLVYVANHEALKNEGGVLPGHLLSEQESMSSSEIS